MSKTYPTELYPTDADILTLNGQTDPETGLAFIAAGVSPASSPSLQVQFDRRLDRQNRILEPANQGRVVETGTLQFGVFPIWYCLDGYHKEYDGATGQSVSDDATTYVWIDASNVLQTGSAWPGDTTLFLPLAKIVTASGGMTITDYRPMFASPTDSMARDPVDLETGVTGVLPVPNGGTGAATLTGVLKGNGTSPVTASDVDLASEVTGTLPVANGGTGQTAANVVPWFPVIQVDGTLSTGVLKARIVVPTGVSGVIKGGTAGVVTGPTGADILIDIRVENDRVFGDDDGKKILIGAGYTSGNEQQVVNHAFSAEDVITIEIDQVGSGTAGADLTLTLDARTSLQT